MAQFLFLLLLTAPVLGCAQAWSGIINTTRATDWSTVGSGVVQSRTTICATLTSADTTTTINAAIAACPANQVVFFSAGIYTITAGIRVSGHNNVTLRGAGPMQTVLNFTAADVCDGSSGNICVKPSVSTWFGDSSVLPGGSKAADWTAGYAQGTTQITLSTIGSGGTILTVGALLVLDQANDDGTVNGFTVCNDTPPTPQVANNCRVVGGGSRIGRGIPVSPASATTTYSQEQIVTVTNITGSGPYTVTISPGLRANNWRASQNPGAWWPNVVSGVGIEDMTLNYSASTVSYAGITFFTCTGCWVKNVRSIKSKRNHVWVNQSANVVVRDSYFYGAQGGGSESYGIELYQASNSLVENNIFNFVTSPVINGDANSGNVAGYNYTLNNYYSAGGGAWMQMSNAGHNAGNHMHLFEGNDMNGLTCDDWHGKPGGGTTAFRNRFTGWEPGKSSNTTPITFQAGCRAMNAIGNVIGTSTYHIRYESSPSFPPGDNTLCLKSIYQLAYSYTTCHGASLPDNPLDDTMEILSLFRWGNYDTVSAAVRWESSEVPTAALTYIDGNPVPASQTLPASFYLSSRPSWWKTPAGTTTPPWPAIGPDVTGGSGPGGFAYDIPAKVCFGSQVDDLNYTGIQHAASVVYGTGYTVNDVLTIVGGTGTAAVLTATSVSGGLIQGVSITNAGNYSVFPTSPASVTGGTGTGATFLLGTIKTFDGRSCYLVRTSCCRQ